MGTERTIAQEASFLAMQTPANTSNHTAWANAGAHPVPNGQWVYAEASRTPHGTPVPLATATGETGASCAPIPTYTHPPVAFYQNLPAPPSTLLSGAGPSHVTHQPSPPIDPALIPLPPVDQEEMVTVGHRSPASKTAGARRSAKPRRKDKGKGRAVEPEPLPSLKRKRGRASGATNYTTEETNQMLMFVHEELPVGAKGWAVVGGRYRCWAEEVGVGTRKDKAIENKFKQLVKETKPTGKATCPPHVLYAKEIEQLISEKVGTRDLDDEDIADVISSDDSDSDSSGDELDGPPRKSCRPATSSALSQKPPVARAVKIEQELPSAGASVRRPRGGAGAGLEILSQISQNFTPAAQAARETSRTERALQSTQIMALNDQIRDANATITDVRNQLMASERTREAAERRADRIEQRLEMMQMMHSFEGRDHHDRHRYSPYSRHPSRDFSPVYRRHLRQTPHSPITPSRRQSRYDVTYRDGGRARYFATPAEAHDLFNDPSRSPGIHVERHSLTPSPQQHRRNRARSSTPHHGPVVITPVRDAAIGLCELQQRHSRPLLESPTFSFQRSTSVEV
ncbi:hypothetical protein QCA50_011169 [Cerrena zonata]|uniref:DUF6818 domain-containing protein n=1 Tax=Cerrena zonata TaxID=2478898 RepID=A0AAW0FWD2_9APHY